MISLAEISARRRSKNLETSKPNCQNATTSQTANGRANTDKGQNLRMILALMFLTSIMMPIYFTLGPIRMTPYRVFLIVFIILTPFLRRNFVSFRLNDIDVLIFLYILWFILSIIVINGASLAIEPGGVAFIETYGAFLIGRLLIRDASDMRHVFLAMAMAALVLLPFAFYENRTGIPIIIETLGKFVPAHVDVSPPARHGMERAQVVFEHPHLIWMLRCKPVWVHDCFNRESL
jgi:hypothetical protein